MAHLDLIGKRIPEIMLFRKFWIFDYRQKDRQTNAHCTVDLYN